MKHRVLISLALLVGAYIQAITLTYSLKNHQIVRTPQAAEPIQRQERDAEAAAGTSRSSYTTVAVAPIYYQRERHIVVDAINVCEKSVVGGSLIGARYTSPENWWIDILTGIETEHVRATGTIPLDNSRTGFDDFVFEVGWTDQVTECLQWSWYATGGVPTTTEVTLQERFTTPVGTRFFSAGLGTEITYGYETREESLLAFVQARFLHFFDRDWNPILPCGARIEPGNTLDFLFNIQRRYRRNIFEVGYTPTFFMGQSTLVSGVRTNSPNFIRSTAYITATHVTESVCGSRYPFIIGIGMSGGISTRFDTRIFSCWLNVGTVF